VEAAYARAAAICEEDVAGNRALGQHGLAVLRSLAQGKGRPLRVLTHCNAGWLATVDWGTALAPVYAAREAGLPVEVWVSETRPRNQGLLTAWELQQYGIPHTVVADNAAGHLMQKGLVDLCITGTDRTTARGDVCNKIGTYLKALAARANGVPFYAGVPGSSIDWSLEDGAEIPIEERSAAEVTTVAGRTAEGDVTTVEITTSAAANPAFDVTPAALVTGLITERGVCEPGGLRALYGK
jgi:methylthioribose-1-phosphate isomerase